MEKITHQDRIKPWMGVVLFAVVMAVFILICAPLQMKYGIPGLIATELIVAGIGILYCLITRVKISEVLPMKKITLRDFFGCVLLLISTYMVSIISALVMPLIYPPCASEAAEISDMLYGNMNYLSTLFVVALLPAICEETIYRGAILSSFRGIKKEWIAMVVVGLFFSINHLSILRGPFTFVLGMVLTYVVIKKNNILLSMMMHFMLNGFSATLAYVMSKSTDLTAAAESSASTSTTLMSIGAFLILGCAAPVLFITAKMLLDPMSHKATKYIYAGILSGVMFLSGICILAVSTNNSTVTNLSFSYDVTEADHVESTYFSIEEDNSYTISVSMANADGFYHAMIVDSEGNIACESDMGDGLIKTYTSTVELHEGGYQLVIESDSDAVGSTPAVSFRVQK